MINPPLCEHCAELSASWIPRGECGPWPTYLIILYIGANVAICIAYWFITITLIRECVKTKTYAIVGSSAATVGFGLFIALCGTGHLEGPVAFRWPHYPTFTAWHSLTACVSVFVAATFPRAVRRYREAVEENAEFRRHFGEVISKINSCQDTPGD